MNIHLGVFVIPNQQSRVEVNDVNTVRDAGLVVPATRSEATPPPTPAAHDGTSDTFLETRFTSTSHRQHCALRRRPLRPCEEGPLQASYRKEARVAINKWL
jgi:hypothetical protein